MQARLWLVLRHLLSHRTFPIPGIYMLMTGWFFVKCTCTSIRWQHFSFLFFWFVISERSHVRSTDSWFSAAINIEKYLSIGNVLHLSDDGSFGFDDYHWACNHACSFRLDFVVWHLGCLLLVYLCKSIWWPHPPRWTFKSDISLKFMVSYSGLWLIISFTIKRNRQKTVSKQIYNCCLRQER